MFHVGQEVVCVNDESEDVLQSKPPLVKGRTYIIERVDVEDGLTYVDVVGIRVLCSLYEDRASWYATRFAPVRKTDISIFQKMLKPIKETSDA